MIAKRTGKRIETRAHAGTACSGNKQHKLPIPKGAIYTPLALASRLQAGLETGKYRRDEYGDVERRCPVCGDFHPATTEFFTPASNADGFYCCRACYAEKVRPSGAMQKLIKFWGGVHDIHMVITHGWKPTGTTA